MNTTLVPEATTTGTPFIVVTIPVCQWILYSTINSSGIRVWDVAILVPNCLFLLFLLFYLRDAVVKLRLSSNPVFTAFYVLVLSVSTISVLRCIVSMTVNAAINTVGDYTDKTLWLVLRFFLLATELSVVVFGVASGHLDSRTVVQRILIGTFTVALVYAVIQGIMEFEYCHPHFSKMVDCETNNSVTDNYDLFAHGGMIFLFTTSIFFFLVYTTIVVIPFTRLREKFIFLPTKRLFYYYCSILAALNLCQAIGSMLLYKEIIQSLCAVDATTYLYFTLYNPLVYIVFLWSFFKVAQTGIQFSYRHQEDEGEDEQVSLPYSNSVMKQELHSPVYPYDSTYFDVHVSSRRSSSSGYLDNSVPDNIPSGRVSLSLNNDFGDFSPTEA